jgi:aldehyde:ferredoxin oxidoreductase
MVNKYYRERKWDDEGIPLPSKMEELGLEAEMKICPSQHPNRKQ